MGGTESVRPYAFYGKYMCVLERQCIFGTHFREVTPWSTDSLVLGNMAGAILRGMAGSRLRIRHALRPQPLARKNAKLSAGKSASCRAKVRRRSREKADVLVLGVKPQNAAGGIRSIKDAIHPDKLVVTIAAGKGFSFYASYFGENVPRARHAQYLRAAGPVLGERCLPECSVPPGTGGA